MKIDGWMRFPSPAQSDFPRRVKRETEAYIRKLTFSFRPVKAEADHA
jgi:hypothetical protein